MLQSVDDEARWHAPPCLCARVSPVLEAQCFLGRAREAVAPKRAARRKRKPERLGPVHVVVLDGDLDVCEAEIARDRGREREKEREK
jgi:hypothetical protein